MTLEEIWSNSPVIPGYGGGKWAMYSVHCCWWTSFPKDLGTIGEHRLPCCPHCGSVLMQAPLDGFVEAARQNPSHYGDGGLETFVKAHSRNSQTCHRKWSEYNTQGGNT